MFRVEYRYKIIMSAFILLVLISLLVGMIADKDCIMRILDSSQIILTELIDMGMAPPEVMNDMEIIMEGDAATYFEYQWFGKHQWFGNNLYQIIIGWAIVLGVSEFFGQRRRRNYYLYLNYLSRSHYFFSKAFTSAFLMTAVITILTATHLLLSPHYGMELPAGGVIVSYLKILLTGIVFYQIASLLTQIYQNNHRLGLILYGAGIALLIFFFSNVKFINHFYGNIEVLNGGAINPLPIIVFSVVWLITLVGQARLYLKQDI